MDRADIDLADLDHFTAGFPHEVFTLLRREAPVWRHPDSPKAPGGEGFWVLSRHAEMSQVARNARDFSSERGGTREGGGTTLEDLPYGVGPGVLLNMMDPPRHDRFRQLVSRGFTPRTIRSLEQQLQARVHRILDAAAEKQELDFLMDVAKELPLQAIAGLLGVPQEHRHDLFEWAQPFIDFADREVGASSASFERAVKKLHEYGSALIEDKRRSPGDDMLSLVIHAELPGEDAGERKLSDAEVMRFFNLLIIAGSDTTRNAIAHGLMALVQHPEQLEDLRRDRTIMPSAVEEILRWTSPVSYNRRTATRDLVLGGEEIRAGEKVTCWWPSANRDEAVFADPFRFDLRRDARAHMAFGHGVHHCLGAALARSEIRLMFDAILDRFETIELTGPPVWVRSNKHHGIRHLPVRMVPRR